MNKSLFLVIVILFSQLTNLHSQSRKELLLGADFQFHGKWFTEKDKATLNGTVLRFIERESEQATDALTIYKFEKLGKYQVWVRTPDFATNPKTRFFEISIADQTLQKVGGHGKVGYHWELAGAVSITEKENIIRLHNLNYARCDAILFAEDASFDPNTLDTKKLMDLKKNPEFVVIKSEEKKDLLPAIVISEDDPIAAQIENEHLRIQFVKSGVNQNILACKSWIKKDEKWISVGNASLEDHKVFLLTANQTGIRYKKFYPTWDNNQPETYFVFNDQKYPVEKPGGDFNPFRAGDLSEAIPVKVNKQNEQTLEVQYVTKNGSVILGLWHLPSNKQHAELRLVCKAARPGYYSLGVSAYQAIADSELGNVMMAPMFQYKRVSEEPQMMTTNMMQQPTAIITSKNAQTLTSTFVAVDTASLRGDWGILDYSPAGFTLKNFHNQLQPTMFSPVMGMNDSKYEAGQLIDRKFILGAIPKDWDSTLTYISNEVFEVKDYRKQYISLTEAAFNMIDLIKNDTAGGWAPKLKGFYDIEGDPTTAATVVNATPLLNISLSILQKDEAFYLSHSLPTIEFTLSRSGYRWAKDIVPSAFNNSLKSLELNPFRSQFTTSYYVGLDRLLSRLNPWLKEIALPNDSLRNVKGYSTEFLRWNQALWAYEMTNDSKWLSMAKKDADSYIKNKIYSNTAKPLIHTPFYNTSFYAPWWDLIDLYDITKDEKYLNAAAYGSFFTIAGIRSYPRIEDKMMTIHPKNQYQGNTHIWWKENKPYRLGFPRQKDDVLEKQVPDWLVSPIGLGLEQPSTYFTRAKEPVRPVYMSNWAPHFLRLFQHTHKPIFEIYARNGIIGRFANYPGYYGTGFTDVNMDINFPYKGPDVSSIYYHHIPPHLSFTVDYLVSDMIQRSNKNVHFPYSKQEGFVWFNNRIYGGAKGKIFNDSSVELWIKKGLITIDNPLINYVTAISNNRFWILLASESEKTESLKIKLSPETHITTSGTSEVYKKDGDQNSISYENSELSLNIGAKGFQAISLPLTQNNQTNEHPSLKKGMYTMDLGAPWGKVTIYRIRSPFGWDSVYGFAETSPLKNVSLTVTCNEQNQTISTYPFEFSFKKFKLDEPIDINIQATDSNGKLKTLKTRLDAK